MDKQLKEFCYYKEPYGLMTIGDKSNDPEFLYDLQRAKTPTQILDLAKKYQKDSLVILTPIIDDDRAATNMEVDDRSDIVWVATNGKLLVTGVSPTEALGALMLYDSDSFHVQIEWNTQDAPYKSEE